MSTAEASAPVPFTKDDYLARMHGVVKAAAILANEVTRPELAVECLRVHQPIPGKVRNARF